MKKALFFFICTLLVSTAFSQRTVFGGNWQINTVGVNLGLNVDIHPNMSMDWMRAHTKLSEVVRYDNGYTNRSISGSVGGGVFGGQIGLNRTSSDYTGFDNTSELILSANVIAGREALISFHNTDPETNFKSTTSTMFCLVDNEFQLGAEYRKMKKKGIFNLYAGLGVSAASTFACEMWIFKNRSFNYQQDPEYIVDDYSELRSRYYQESFDTYAGNCSMYLRAYTSAGVGMVIANHLELSMDLRLGGGAEFIYNSNVSSSFFNFSTMTGLKWRIPQNNPR
ncbi:MAG: hypothetical protein HKN32_06370 [Flavobacteriales bacterium]|nr:hypothetical protein [Flavobacteriales bacterium]